MYLFRPGVVAVAQEGLKELSGLARFGLAVLAVLIILSGGALIIAGSSGLFALDPVPAEAPGLAVIALGFYVLFRSGRRGKGELHDPDSHRVLPRDVEDQLESLYDDDERDG